MARTVLPVTTTAAAGVIVPASTPADAVNGMMFANNGRAVLQITNGGAGSINVTFTGQAKWTVGTTQYNITVPPSAVAAGQTKQFGPFDPTTFNDPATGSVWVDFSAATSVTCLVTQLGTQ